MDKPIDKLQMLKERYEKERMNGDLSEAARMAKVSTPNASTALARESWDQLTKSERKAMICLSRVLDQRKAEEAEVFNN